MIMNERKIKIDFDKFGYEDGRGINVLLKVSCENDINEFVEISNFSYNTDEYNSTPGEKAIIDCIEQFTEDLQKANIHFDNDAFKQGGYYCHLIEDKINSFLKENPIEYQGHFYVSEVFRNVTNNSYGWSTFVVDVCFDKVCHGQIKLTPGQDKVPKTFNFIYEKLKCYAKILSIELVKKDQLDNLSDIKVSRYGKICIAFQRHDCEQAIVFELGDVYESKDDRHIRYYVSHNVEKYEHSKKQNMFVLRYDLDECRIEIKTSSAFNDNVAPLLNYYDLLLDDLNKKSDQVNLEIDLKFLRENYVAFADLIPDDDLITLPVKGKGVKIKSITIASKTFSGEENRYNFYEASISTFSNEDFEEHIETLKESGIKLPKDRSLVLLDVIELYDKDKFFLKKLLNDGNVSTLVLKNNIEGEKIRLKRIVSGIENSIRGNVVNSNLVSTICKTNILKDIPTLLREHPYRRNEQYIDYLKKEYGILSNNNEQLETVDKVVQMTDNDIDAMVIQGPPGTGKTEVILAIAKELIKRKQNVLITSNVHVACDNIVERLKNNKDVVLKRYTTTRGEQYEKELVENQKRYIENQILAGFKVDDKTITSLEIYDLLCSQRDSFIKKRNQILKRKNEYDDKLAPYNNCKKRKNEIEEECKNNRKEISTLEKEILKDDNDILKLNNKITKLNSDLTKLEEKAKQKELDLNKIELNLNSLGQELSNIYDEVTECKIKYNNAIKAESELTETIDKNKKLLLSEEKKLAFLKELNIHDLKESVFSFAISKKPFSDNQKMIIEKYIDEINFLSDFKTILELDECFWNKNRDFNLNTLEYVIFTASKSKYCSDYLENDTISVLKDIHRYCKQGKLKMKIMSLFSFVKLKGENYNYYNNCIEKLNNDLKKIKYNFTNLLSNVIDKIISGDELTTLYDKLLNNVDALKKSIINDNLLLDQLQNEKTNLLAKTEYNKVDAKNKTREIQECQQSLHFSKIQKEDFEREYVDKCRDEVDENNKILDSKSKLKNEKIDKKESLILKNDALLVELDTVNQKIKEMEFSLQDLLGNYDVFLGRHNIDLSNINRIIDKFTSILDKIDMKIQILKDSGWDINDAQQLIFKYVEELEKIVRTDTSNIDNYIKGRGSIFTNMFLLSQGNDGSLVSMTTNQISSLLNSTTSHELTFDYAIVDEASKCKFEDIIISLPRIKHLVLIGDFMQLDPIYDEYKNIDLRYQSILNPTQWENMNKSTFSLLLSQFVEYNERKKIDNFDSNPCVSILKRQYRMNKGIFNLIKPIYSIHKGFDLIDGKQMTSNDIKCIEINGNEIEKGTSFQNIEEGDAVDLILKFIKENKQSYPSIKTIGIITGYRAQQSYLMRKLKNFKIPSTQIQIGTFDRFQGREYDLVIVSLVRTIKLGFTDNVRRMNVAFSRAKEHLLVLGDFTSLLNISRKALKASKENDSSILSKENSFVANNIIPKLYDMKEEFVSADDLTSKVNDFLRESDYE